MEQRYGAWTRLCVLFRLIFDGAKHNAPALPARKGHLFDRTAGRFGRPTAQLPAGRVRLDVPKVSDAAVYRVLQKLLILDGDRLSYRALDVEQIGSVYGMWASRSNGPVICRSAWGQHVVISLDAACGQRASERNKWLKEPMSSYLARRRRWDATTHDDLVAALERRRSPLTKQPIPKGGLYLQPTDEQTPQWLALHPRD